MGGRSGRGALAVRSGTHGWCAPPSGLRRYRVGAIQWNTAHDALKTSEHRKSRTPRQRIFLVVPCILSSNPSGCNLTVMEDHLDGWFKREILAHEESLVRYLYR